MNPVPINDPVRNDELCRVFNTLTKADRMKLKAAAATEILTAFIRDDTRKAPWKYPFYLAYLFFLITPLPFPGDSVFILGGTYLWARSGVTPGARILNRRLSESFAPAALVANHERFIVPHPTESGRFYIQNKKLAIDVTLKNLRDARDMTGHAWGGLKRVFA